MLRKSIFFGLTLGLSLAAYGCGSDSDDNQGAQTTDPTEEPCNCGLPPEDPEAGPGDGEGVVLAINKLFLGDTDRSGNPDPNAWKNYGYNLDNYASTVSSKNVCKPRAGGQPSIHNDGNNGIDNAFGKGILPLITNLEPEPTARVNAEIEEGSFTLMLKLDGVGTADNYSGIKASLYAGGSLENPPAWDGNDEWPVLTELLEGGDINKPKVVFTDSYVANRTWVGKADALTVNLSLSGVTLGLTIRNAIVTMDLDSNNAGAKNGIIAGILEVDELLKTIQDVAQNILCEDISGFESIINSIGANADILKDGTQDPNQVCDGISIGLGFEALPVKLGPVTEPAEPGEGC